MPITVQLIAGRPPGRSLAEVQDVRFPPLDEQEANFPLMSGVDPYSYTVFNQLQMKRLPAEIDELVPLLAEQEQSPLLRVRDLAQTGAKRPHHNLVFLGD